MSGGGPRGDALAALAQLDRQLHPPEAMITTLDPRRQRATGLVELVHQLVPPPRVQPLADALARGLSAIVRAMLAAFPGNLLWDLDGIAGALVRDARGLEDHAGVLVAAAQLEVDAARIAELQAVFGGGTTIRFRYVHDFVYGYDWAKWVRRDPDARSDVGPYAREFIAAMHERGAQLLALIEQDDATYPRLRDAAPRNPFPFSREPAAELTLHRALAAAGQVPVAAWRCDAPRAWAPDPAAARVACAARLGLACGDPLRTG